MMPVIEREIVGRKKWIDKADMTDMISLAGSAPGGVGVNAAAFVGFRKAGFPGAVAAVMGVTFPTFLIVIILSLFYLYFNDNPKVEAALKGIHGAVVALILMAAYRMLKTSVFDAATAFVSIAALMFLFANINPLYIIVCGLLGGIVLIQMKRLMGLKTNTEKTSSEAQKPEPVYLEYYI